MREEAEIMDELHGLDGYFFLPNTSFSLPYFASNTDSNDICITGN
jgi:hypothetical protein